MIKSYSDEVNFSKRDTSEFSKPTSFTKTSPDTRAVYGNDSIKPKDLNQAINEGLVFTPKKPNDKVNYRIIDPSKIGESGENGNNGKILINTNGSKINSKAFKLDGKSGKLGLDAKN